MSEWKKTEVGCIPIKWNVLTINDLKDEKKNSISMGPFGSNITKNNFVNKGVPVIRGNNLHDFNFYDSDFVFVTNKKADELKNSLCYSRDIIITHRGTLGQVGIIPLNSRYDRYIVSQSGMKLTVNANKIESLFVFYYLKSRIGQYHLLRNTSQVGVPAIAQPTTSFKAIPVPVPQINEQKAIASILTSLDSKIDLLRRQNQTLENIAQTLFKRWFVDFEFPDENGKPYKSSGGNMVESELGEIPVRWDVVFFLEVFTLLSGGTPQTGLKEYWNGDIKWVSAKDITSNHKKFIMETEKKISTEGMNKSATKLLPKFAIIISARGTVGNYCIIPEKMCISQSNYGIVSKINKINFYTYLIVSNTVKQLKAQAYGSVFDTITTATFRNIQMSSPYLEILFKFENLINPLFSKILINTQQIQTLTKTRDTLLPKLMSGQLRVPITKT